ncbi:hypothetical protein [Nonomuraea gerenzanensis]|uniref:hypothetical protein n=1 Tax=Nonomuraea gerenzanensis TaxID=93944 RepID=UPI001CD975B1|nr:hypothetical protein [Nonomuraea gerenzanensis]UBU14285.1 hypothetical protein LCN96_04450 [Nonomuraea gerenzanensis]
MSLEDFHGLHPNPPKEGYIRIDWCKPTDRAVSIRVQAHTCNQELTTYELCATGGLSHIRRTQRTSAGDRVRESPWMHTSKAQRLWNGLLDGRAR